MPARPAEETVAPAWSASCHAGNGSPAFNIPPAVADAAKPRATMTIIASFIHQPSPSANRTTHPAIPRPPVSNPDPLHRKNGNLRDPSRVRYSF